MVERAQASGKGKVRYERKQVVGKARPMIGCFIQSGSGVVQGKDVAHTLDFLI